MAHTAVTAPALTVLDLPAGERNLIGLARVSADARTCWANDTLWAPQGMPLKITWPICERGSPLTPSAELSPGCGFC